MDLKYKVKASKFLKKCSNKLNKRLKQKINDLLNNPVPPDSKRLKGRDGKIFRIRVGDYRVLYELINNDIVIIDIAKRSTIYRIKDEDIE